MNADTINIRCRDQKIFFNKVPLPLISGYLYHLILNKKSRWTSICKK